MKAPGFVNRSSDSSSLKADYVFLLGESALLNVRIDAKLEGQGLALIAPIVDSLSFDTRSPVVQELFFDPPTIKAGETAKLKIRASDNLSGVHSTMPDGSAGNRGCRIGTVLGECVNFHDLGGGWYEFDIATHERQNPGTFTLYGLSLWDGAGNPRFLTLDLEGKAYDSIYSEPQARLAVASLKIENDNPDLVKPILQNVRFEPAEIRAGSRGKFVFNAGDDDSGLVNSERCGSAVYDGD